MKKPYQIIIILSLFLYGCGNRAAVDEAKAYQIRQETDQVSLNAEQTRKANEEAARQKLIDDTYWNGIFDSAIVSVKRVANFVVYSIGIALCIIALGGGWTIKETAIGLGQARVARAQLEACLIYMDRSTRTYPAFKSNILNGSCFITMLETGQIFRLDKSQDANPLLVSMLAQTSAIGAFAQEASKVGVLHGNDVSVFNPTRIIGEVHNTETSKND